MKFDPAAMTSTATSAEVQSVPDAAELLRLMREFQATAPRPLPDLVTVPDNNFLGIPDGQIVSRVIGDVKCMFATRSTVDAIMEKAEPAPKDDNPLFVGALGGLGGIRIR
jgi:hypothetical protein